MPVRHKVTVLADRDRLVAALDAILDNVVGEYAQGSRDVFASGHQDLG
jgi:hypothetical protein